MSGPLDDFYAGKRRAQDRIHAALFSPETEALLTRLPPALSTEVRPTLRRVARARHMAHPLSWAEGTKRIFLASLLEAVSACGDAGVVVDGVATLAKPIALDAVEARTSAGRWSPITVARIFRQVRMANRLVHGSCPDGVSRRASRHGAALRRYIWHRLHPTSRYVEGAHVLSALAAVFMAAGRTRGQTLARDALLLAFAAESTLRLGELAAIRVGMLELREIRNRPCVEIFISKAHSKVGFGRIARIFDPRTIARLTPLLGREPQTPVFSDVDGKALGRAGIATSLARTGALTVGAHACANLLRRAGVLDAPEDREERRKRLGQAPGSRLAETTYMQARPQFGHALVQQAVTQAAVRSRS